MHKFLGSIALIAALAMIGFNPAVAISGDVKDSGSIDAAYANATCSRSPRVMYSC